jgi:tetratricopeptide (TPR) repeat protein
LVQGAPAPGQGQGKKTVRCLAVHQKQIKRYVTAGMDEFERLKYRRALSKIDRAVRYAEARGCHQHAAYARALVAKAVVYFDGKRDRDRAFGLLARAFKIHHSVGLAGKPSVTLVRLFDDVRLAAHAETASKTAKQRSLALQRWSLRLARSANLRYRRVTDGASSTLRLRLRRASNLAAAGDKLLKKNKLNAAYQIYRKALRLAPNSLALRERFGVVQLRLGDYSGALRTVEWIRKRAGDARADRLRFLQRKLGK